MCEKESETETDRKRGKDIRGFNLFRKNGNLLLNLFELMASSGIPGIAECVCVCVCVVCVVCVCARERESDRKIIF